LCITLAARRHFDKKTRRQQVRSHLVFVAFGLRAVARAAVANGSIASAGASLSASHAGNG